MSIPVSVSDIVHGRKVEDARLEYKRGWNPERILHTICAFANDIDGWSGGYIIVGVDMESGLPEVVGLDRASVDGMQKELVSLTNLIEPRYMPAVEISEVDGKVVMVIWATTGDRRPYSCPVNYSRKSKGSERGYYIRKMSSTIRANQDDVERLFQVSRRTPFDLCINHDASLSDLKVGRIQDFLYDVRSSLADDATDIPRERLCREMKIVSGPKEDLRPMNIGVLFFTDHPEDFIPGSYVDVVYKPVPTGERMEEYRITGPLNEQVVNSMSVISRYIGERIYKSETRLEARRISSYPVRAVRELLVNAVYHKSYEIAEPVRITISPASIEFLNYPGPSATLTDEEIRNNQLVTGIYRNVRIGEYFKELGLAESRFTGIPRVVESLKENGSPPLRIVTDPNRTYFRAILEIHPDFTAEVESTADAPIDERIVSILGAEGCMRVLDLSLRLGYKGINSTVRSAIGRLMAEGVVEYLYPDAPRSPKQRVCLVSKRRSRHRPGSFRSKVGGISNLLYENEYGFD